MLAFGFSCGRIVEVFFFKKGTVDKTQHDQEKIFRFSLFKNT
jgi:hypothetical protein